MSKTLKNIFAAVLILVSLSVAAKTGQPKYVFYMIGDGMGINQVYGTQIYNVANSAGPAVINFTQFPVKGFVTTHSASSLVTDSAAAGTALSTGTKTYNDAMGVDMDKNPLSNIAEWAKAAGFGTGVATSVGVNHATPAAFYAHAASRSEYEKLAEQLIASKMDFAAGAGFLNEEKKTGHNSQYLEGLAKDAGITILRGEELKNAASHKERVIAFSANPADTELKYAIDREEGETKLADFVQAGIDNLYAKYAKKGFFFMIEGGKIDYAAHNDDGTCTFQEVNDFAETIDVVLDFYNQHPNETLIVITADHETGALMLGSGQYAMSAAVLAAQKKSEVVLNDLYKEFVVSKKGRPSWDDTKAWLKQNLGLWDSIPVDPATESALLTSFVESSSNRGPGNVVTLYSVSTRLVSEAIDIVNKRAGYSWAHGAHSGSPVGLYVKGAGSSSFVGCQDNTDVPKTIAKVAGYKK